MKAGTLRGTMPPSGTFVTAASSSEASSMASRTTKRSASILLLTPAFARLILQLNLQPPEFVTGTYYFELRALSLTQQLGYYKEYQSKVTKLVGIEKAKGMFSAGIHLLSVGNSDYLHNYYINSHIYRQYAPD
ncbi:GDSL esterase/lipase At5g03810-like [Spinacia oleracea]|uniref:GDSL esterase/lipase At5g03810-like n=1 Tax=Spinacia oleracea TaxID=3562 RepID=A0ABM3QYD0_SPIOL|nr:GDSL esterase/lipase At5g03810-like [Spinacia oleracea]